MLLQHLHINRAKTNSVSQFKCRFYRIRKNYFSFFLCCLLGFFALRHVSPSTLMFAGCKYFCFKAPIICPLPFGVLIQSKSIRKENLFAQLNSRPTLKITKRYEITPMLSSWVSIVTKNDRCYLHFWLMTPKNNN